MTNSRYKQYNFYRNFYGIVLPSLTASEKDLPW